MSEEKTYESAVDRLDEIISRLDSGDAQLRETLDLCAEAKTLIEFCAAELSAVDQGLKELKLDELAQTLAPAQTAPAGESQLEPVPDPIPEQAPIPGDDEVPF
jgi:exodeoxyribonuclease VII small subunit